MKSTVKIFLIIALFVSASFAGDGDLGNGGYTCDGDLGNGGRICTVDCPPAPVDPETPCSERNSNESDSENSILSEIEEYLNELFGTGGN